MASTWSSAIATIASHLTASKVPEEAPLEELSGAARGGVARSMISAGGAERAGTVVFVIASTLYRPLKTGAITESERGTVQIIAAPFSSDPAAVEVFRDDAGCA